MSRTSSQELAEQDHSPELGRVIDLRSDTVTQPTPEMRKAMAEAEVGDDVYGEDPTVNRLEAMAARMFEREAALFVPTGTMGNQIAIKVHTQPGQEIVCEDRAHILDWEMGMAGWFSGCTIRPIQAEDGILTWKAIERQIPARSYARAQTGLIEIENTHNMAGGTITPPEQMEEICDRAHERGIPVHLDGARIFNAAVALGRSVAEMTRKVDSIMFCLSKGLCAPVGSMLVGSAEFIEHARSVRKALGGGMRQAGILAAAGIIAIRDMPKRLHEDHANARALAERLREIPRLKVYPEKVKTNIVAVDISATGLSSAQMLARFRQKSLIAGTVNDSILRFLTHKDVSRQDCEAAATIVAAVCRQVGGSAAGS